MIDLNGEVMEKSADNKYSLNELIKKRWSPVAFSDKPIDKEKLYSLLEAARWSASCFNEQPWRFIVGQENDEVYEKIKASLVEKNREWAKDAPILIANVAKKNFTHNEKNNRWASYDLGQAVAVLSIQATELGLYVHQMGGFDENFIKESFKLSEDYEVLSIMAIGYYGNVEELSDDLKKREMSDRKRKEISELILEINT